MINANRPPSRASILLRKIDALWAQSPAVSPPCFTCISNSASIYLRPEGRSDAALIHGLMYSYSTAVQLYLPLVFGIPFGIDKKRAAAPHTAHRKATHSHTAQPHTTPLDEMPTTTSTTTTTTGAETTTQTVTTAVSEEGVPPKPN